MAVPTITSVSPASGHTGGRTLVELVGTGFRLPTASSPGTPLPLPAPPESVRVTFGGRIALSVEVLSATLVRCLTPKGDHDGTGMPKACNVVVSNLDDDGDVIAWETVTKTNGYSYALVKLTTPSDVERVTKALVEEFARQVCPTAMTTVDSDYDSETTDGLNIPDTSKMPAVVIQGPDLHFSHWFTTLPDTEEAIYDGEGNVLAFNNRVWSPYMDLTYQLTVICDTTGQLHRLMVDAREFVLRCPYLVLPRDPADPSGLTVAFLLQIPTGAYPKNTTIPRLSNLKTFTMGIVVRGVTLDDNPVRGDDQSRVVSKTYPVETINLGVDSL